MDSGKATEEEEEEDRREEAMALREWAGGGQPEGHGRGSER